MALTELLGTRPLGTGTTRFDVGRELHGAYGGAFGGVVAACTLVAARDLAPGRVPTGLDVRFLRGLPAGESTAHAEIVHQGRSVTVVGVDIHSADDRLSVRATVSLAAPEMLESIDVAEPSGAALPCSYDEARPWPNDGSREIPIITSLAPRILGRVEGGVATALRLPWLPDHTSAAEAACFAADMCTGPPVAAALVDGWIPHPNIDLALRFAGAVEVAPEVIGIGTVSRIAGGVAVVDIEVRTAGAVVAVGAATSLLMSGKAG